MSWTNEQTHNAIVVLKKYYDTRFFLKRWFFPQDLAQALNDYPSNALLTDDNPSATKATQQVIGCFFKPRSFIYYWFFPKLNFLAADSFFPIVKQSPSKQEKKLIVQAINVVSCHNTLTLDMAEAVVNYANRIHQLDLSKQLANHSNHTAMLKALHRLHQVGLSQVNKEIINHPDPSGLAQSILELHEAGFFRDKEALAHCLAMATHKDYQAVAKGLRHLKEKNLTDGEDASAHCLAVINNEYPEAMANVLSRLHHTGLLQSDNGAVHQTILSHSNARDLDYVFSHLEKVRLLTGDHAQTCFAQACRHATILYNTQAFDGFHNNWFTLAFAYWQKLIVLCDSSQETLAFCLTQLKLFSRIKNYDPVFVLDVLCCLHQSGLLSSVISHAKPVAILDALYKLHQIGLSEIDKEIINHPDPSDLTRSILGLRNVGFFRGEEATIHCLAIANHKNYQAVANGLRHLKEKNLTDGENARAHCLAVVNSEYPEAMANVLSRLDRTGLLTSDNGAIYQAVLNHPNVRHLDYVSDYLEQAGLLTGERAQTCFAQACRHATVLCYTQKLSFPTRLLTFDHWQQLTAICEGYRDMDMETIGHALNAYITSFILVTNNQTQEVNGIRQNRRRVNVNFSALIGREDNTHTASVNLSTNLTAWLLATYYKAATLSPSTVQTEYKALIAAVEETTTPRTRFAVAALKRLDKEVIMININTDDKKNCLTVVKEVLTDQPKVQSLLPALLNDMLPDSAQQTTTLSMKYLMILLNRAINEECERKLKKNQNKYEKIINDNIDNKELKHKLDGNREEYEKIINKGISDKDYKRKLDGNQTAYEKIVTAGISDENCKCKLNNNRDKYRKIKTQNIDAWIDTLYEIERGKNMDAQGNDTLKGPNLPICPGGTANKLCEHFVGSSPLIHLFYIIEATIDLKIKQYFEQQLISYLTLLSRRPDDNDFLTAMAQLQNPDQAEIVLTECWQRYGESIKKTICDEFKVYTILYGENMLKTVINNFVEHALPYLGHLPDVENNVYSATTQKLFNELLVQVLAVPKPAESSNKTNSSVSSLGLFSNNSLGQPVIAENSEFNSVNEPMT